MYKKQSQDLKKNFHVAILCSCQGDFHCIPIGVIYVINVFHLKNTTAAYQNVNTSTPLLVTVTSVFIYNALHYVSKHSTADCSISEGETPYL